MEREQNSESCLVGLVQSRIPHTIPECEDGDEEEEEEDHDDNTQDKDEGDSTEGSTSLSSSSDHHQMAVTAGSSASSATSASSVSSGGGSGAGGGSSGRGTIIFSRQVNLNNGGSRAPPPPTHFSLSGQPCELTAFRWLDIRGQGPIMNGGSKAPQGPHGDYRDLLALKDLRHAERERQNNLVNGHTNGGVRHTDLAGNMNGLSVAPKGPYSALYTEDRDLGAGGGSGRGRRALPSEGHGDPFLACSEYLIYSSALRDRAFLPEGAGGAPPPALTPLSTSTPTSSSPSTSSSASSRRLQGVTWAPEVMEEFSREQSWWDLMERFAEGIYKHLI